MKKTVLLSFIILFFYQSSYATIFTVNDNSDVSTGSGTTGTLRWCITQANLTAAKDTIQFSIAATFNVMNTNGNYPTIIYPLCINGFSAPGAAQGQLGTAIRQLKVILNGGGSSTIYGLQISAANCEIKGLVIQDFYKGIYITGSTATGNWIWGNYIGTAADGLSISASTTCWDDGIAINNNAGSNIIGTNGDGSNDANEGNLITGNGDGAQFYGEGVAINEGGTISTDCSANRIAGNFIGTNETGTSALYTTGLNTQRGSGVQINYSTANIIGTNGDGVSDALERNVISGNTDCGIVFIASSSNKIKGNYIGTDKTGLIGLPNYANGGTSIISVQISIKTASNSNIVGTDGDGTADNAEGNIIGSITFTAGSSGSYNYGMVIQGSTGNRVAGNNIGIGSDGVTALNIKCTSATYIDKCIYISSSSTSTVIGTNGDGVSDSYEANYFGNSSQAVAIDNSNSCIVAGNYFGLSTNLTTAEPLNTTTSSAGVYILNSTSCRIGSSASISLERNYFCNSVYDGVWIDGAATASTDANTIQYNTFGMRPDGVAAANAYHAIEIYKASNGNTIQNNIITQNGTVTPDGTYSAVLIGGANSGEESSGNLIYQNTIYKNIGRGIDILNVSGGGSLSVKNKISQNSIYNNGNASNSTATTPAFGKYSLGIDNDWDGPTANDNKDIDNGPNEFSNFPIITGTTSTGTGCTSATISGTFNGLPNTSYYVELFSSDVCNGDTAGVDYYSNATYNYGEGRTYLGASASFTTIATGGSAGNATWTSSIPLTISGKYITAVAIQTSGTNIGNTGEFSQCVPISFDAGDAPDTYHTLLSNCGPTHFGVGATNLKIGSTVTADGDGQPSAAANLDTDDGITTLPALTVKTTLYTLSNIPVVNTSGSTATLYAWIDFNVNGSFEATEFTSTVVANNATTATLTWNLASFTCGTTINPGNSYLRMRLTTDALADVAGTTTVDERCYGRASNGEVEDYKIYISGYDYGDLNSSYPIATALCLEDTATAKVWAGVTMPDRECTENFSADASGDGAEEDGLTTAVTTFGATYNWVIKLNANQANKTVYYGLWIDWNTNNSFADGADAFYTGSAVVNGATNKNVSVSVPSTATNASGVRLIVSDAPITSTMYNSTYSNGEVEDFILLKILASPNNILMGSRQTTYNLLKWNNASALAVTKYDIEKSIDNVSWTYLGSVTAFSGGNPSFQYSYSDMHPGKENYYRIKFTLADGTIAYSNVLPLFDKAKALPILVYPNPAKNLLTIHTANSNYNSFKIFDPTGRIEKSNEINTVNTTVDISNLAPGTHFIKFITNSGTQEVQRFVKIK